MSTIPRSQLGGRHPRQGEVRQMAAHRPPSTRTLQATTLNRVNHPSTAKRKVTSCFATRPQLQRSSQMTQSSVSTRTRINLDQLKMTSSPRICKIAILRLWLRRPSLPHEPPRADAQSASAKPFVSLGVAQTSSDRWKHMNPRLKRLGCWDVRRPASLRRAAWNDVKPDFGNPLQFKRIGRRSRMRIADYYRYISCSQISAFLQHAR
jgi:hypothetical protein